TWIIYDMSHATTLPFFFQAEDGIRDFHVTGVQTCALPICRQTDPRETCSLHWPATRPTQSSPPPAHWRRDATCPDARPTAGRCSPPQSVTKTARLSETGRPCAAPAPFAAPAACPAGLDQTGGPRQPWDAAVRQWSAAAPTCPCPSRPQYRESRRATRPDPDHRARRGHRTGCAAPSPARSLPCSPSHLHEEQRRHRIQQNDHENRLHHS